MTGVAAGHTDWLRHGLLVSGPADDVAGLRSAAQGAGAVPWNYPDLEFVEHDRMLALLNPPDGSAGLSLASARALARLLRADMESRQHKVIEAVGRRRDCPFDLHALLPVPGGMLQLGPDDPAATAWLRAHWGVVQALRHVRLRGERHDCRLRGSARLDYEFWSADWTPWAALSALRRRWPALALDIRLDYGSD